RGGGRASAVGRLRIAARRARHVHERDHRHDLLHASRIHGTVPRARHPLPAAVRAYRERGARRGGARARMNLNTAWFVVLAFTLAVYAVLDGFDLGIGAIHLLLGRTRDERERLIDSIGPVWNGNEVWLLAAGGSMVVAFPNLYAASFSGF